MLAITDWTTLDAAGRAEALARPAQVRDDDLRAAVAEIMAGVRRGGDAAIADYTERFDGVRPASLFAGPDDFRRARETVHESLVEALQTAIGNIRRFHRARMSDDVSVETVPGVVCRQVTRPLDAVGLYVPAGSAPLPSTAMMLSIPAALAGCPRRVLATPPGPDGQADPSVLVAAELCGVDTVLVAGGAQAVAALAYGTQTLPAVDKIFGPGNAWVTEAKQQAAADPDGAAIDMPAGPSEVLVIADETANAEFVAADLLSQAEHGPDSQVILVTTSAALAARVIEAVTRQLDALCRRDIASSALGRSRFIVVTDMGEALAVSNAYAPEHLILSVDQPEALLDDVRAAGSVFLGHWTPESLGDYCSGTNHVLPTYGYARAYSGLSVADFQRRVTVQQASPDGLAALGPVAATIAAAEGLTAHEAAVTVRLAALSERNTA